MRFTSKNDWNKIVFLGREMKVKVKLISTVKELVGQGELDVECGEDATIAALQDILVQQFGNKIIGKTPEYQWLHHGADYIVIALNNEVIEPKQMYQTKLKQGDVVTFLPAISGG